MSMPKGHKQASWYHLAFEVISKYAENKKEIISIMEDIAYKQGHNHMSEMDITDDTGERAMKLALNSRIDYLTKAIDTVDKMHTYISKINIPESFITICFQGWSKKKPPRYYMINVAMRCNIDYSTACRWRRLILEFVAGQMGWIDKK